MLLSQGMTPLEAMEEFDKEEWNVAMVAEMESGILCQHPKTFELMTEDGKLSLLQLSCRASRDKMNDQDIGKALELWMAGWTSHPVRPDSDVFQWQWRASPKRAGKPGRKYLSTEQAFRALKKLK